MIQIYQHLFLVRCGRKPSTRICITLQRTISSVSTLLGNSCTICNIQHLSQRIRYQHFRRGAKGQTVSCLRWMHWSPPWNQSRHHMHINLKNQYIFILMSEMRYMIPDTAIPIQERSKRLWFHVFFIFYGLRGHDNKHRDTTKVHPPWYDK